MRPNRFQKPVRSLKNKYANHNYKYKTITPNKRHYNLMRNI